MTSSSTASTAADKAAIGDIFQQLLNGWNRGSGEAYGAPFMEDSDYISFDGTRTQGREKIAASHQRLFDKWLKGTRLVGQIESIRFLSPDVALIHATGGTLARGASKPSPHRNSIQTLVAVRSDGEWKFTAFHNSRLRPIEAGLASVLIWSFTDLLWKCTLRR
jgi:uncharacterized protein (TIGR02246 family)